MFSAAAIAGFVLVLILIPVFLHEGAKKFPLFEAKEPFEPFHIFLEVFFGLLGLIVILGIEKHGGAHAILAVFAHEYLVVDAALASCPERFVLCEFGIGDRLVAEIRIDLHDGQAGRESEDLGLGIFLTGELEYFLLDRLGDTALAIGGYDDETGICHVFAMAPGFDITESDPVARFGNGDDSLSFLDLLFDIFGRSFGDAGPPGFGRRLHLVSNDG